MSRVSPDQTQLPLPKHDLPPRWDGCIVIWTWRETLPPMFICPPPKPQPCPQCGSLADRLHATGLLAHHPRTTLDQIEGKQRGHHVGDVAHYALAVFRCPDCRHDQVLDIVTNELWDLDPTDYGDTGSTWGAAANRPRSL